MRRAEEERIIKFRRICGLPSRIVAPPCGPRVHASEGDSQTVSNSCKGLSVTPDEGVSLSDSAFHIQL
jgi:hypothetical protein